MSLAWKAVCHVVAESDVVRVFSGTTSAAMPPEYSGRAKSPSPLGIAGLGAAMLAELEPLLECELWLLRTGISQFCEAGKLRQTSGRLHFRALCSYLMRSKKGSIDSARR